MLFNSYEFIFLFLPVSLVGFFWLSGYGRHSAAWWLGGVSLLFYGWWNPGFVLLLLGSILVNYGLGVALSNAHHDQDERLKWLLTFGILANLVLLGYFKYTNFFISAVNQVSGADYHLSNIVLPLGISFFTFTQIAFLVDASRGIAREYRFSHYLLFVTYFPHLIAGPVLHHKQMMPQFASDTTYKPNLDNIAVGLTIFIVGLFKKVVLADQFALYATPVFDTVAHGAAPALIEAWSGALAYSLQLYFDFSGYSDMAVGISRMFNVRLPLNFNSPYKSESIIDFWRRWHMTLSRFLKDYLYIPLGGNRKGPFLRHVNLMVTMLLGGLWHGAGWNYVLWGGLHGIYLVVNHAWQTVSGSQIKSAGGKAAKLSMVVTFLFVVIAWVPFRSADIQTTIRMLAGMSGLNGISIPPLFSAYVGNITVIDWKFTGLFPLTGLIGREAIGMIGVGLFIIWMLPNTQQWINIDDDHARTRDFSLPVGRWRNTVPLAILMGIMFAFTVLGMTRASPFLYFQF